MNISKNNFKNLYSLKGKKIVLTGGAGFFGRYFCRAILDNGAEKLVIVERPGVGGDFKKELGKTYGSKKISWFPVDLYKVTDAAACYRAILKKFGGVDVLVNNAFDFSLRTGFNDPSGKLENVSYEQMKSSFDSGIYWAVQATQILGLDMKKHGGGSIINIGSMYGVVVPSSDLYEGTDKFNPPGYSMAKAGLLQFTKYAASFLSPEVRVNAFSPGAIPNLGGKTYNAITEENPVLKRLHQKILLKRMGHPNDLVGALVFLASDASNYITGQNIVIDGGLTVT